MIKSKTALLHKKCAIKFILEYIILLNIGYNLI